MKWLLLAVVALTLCACAKSSTMPLSLDTIRITSSAAPICGATGAQSVATRRASIETIKRGFDKFLILDSASQNNVGVIGYTPVQANTTGYTTGSIHGGYLNANHSATTTYSGGQPIIGGTHDQGLIVKMFKDGDPAGAQAISARAQLGAKWQDAVEEYSIGTCF